MKILYFDMWSPKGHKVFNNIHLKALGQIGDVYTIFREGYYKFSYPHVTPFLEIPDKYYVKGRGYYYTRIQLASMIRWVWKRVFFEKWDYVILSSYDPFALLLSQQFKNSIVIDHNTLDLLDSKIHGIPLRLLSKDLRHVVFNNAMETKMIEGGIKNVFTVPHGFIPMETQNLSLEEEKEFMQKYSLSLTDKIIFLPSLSTTTNDLVGRYVYNSDFNIFLKEHGLKLFTKSLKKRKSLSNIIILDGYLTDKEYQYLFLHSTCNVLLYSDDFKYRTSGVLNECFANNIPCIISDCPSLKEYLSYINNGDCVFRNPDEFKKSIISVIQRGNCEYYKKLEEIATPLKAWREIIK